MFLYTNPSGQICIKISCVFACLLKYHYLLTDINPLASFGPEALSGFVKCALLQEKENCTHRESNPRRVGRMMLSYRLRFFLPPPTISQQDPRRVLPPGPNPVLHLFACFLFSSPRRPSNVSTLMPNAQLLISRYRRRSVEIYLLYPDSLHCSLHPQAVTLRRWATPSATSLSPCIREGDRQQWDFHVAFVYTHIPCD